MLVDEGTDFGTAEESLAASVHRAGAATQPVQPGRWNRRGVRVADLAGCDAFAEADHGAVGRVGGDGGRVLVRTGEPLADVGHPRRCRHVRTRDGQRVHLMQHRFDVFGDGHTRGQTGGADSTDEDIALRDIAIDEVVAVLGGRTQPRVGGADFLGEQLRHQFVTLLQKEGEASLRRSGGRPVGEIFCGRAEHHVAIDGGADENALAAGGGYRKHDLVDQGARQFVVDQQFTATGGDVKAVVAHA